MMAKLDRARSVILASLEPLLGIAIILCFGALIYRFTVDQTPTHVMLMDRPRDGDGSSDFLTRYLDATGMDYSIEDGFLRLTVSEETAGRLRGLLAATGRAMDLIHEDRRKAIARAFTRSEPNGAASILERRAVEPTPDGKISVTSHSMSWDQSTWQEIDDQLVSLEGQYRAVAEALYRLDPTVVVPQKYTVFEPLGPSEAKLAAMRPSNSDVNRTLPDEEVLELNQVEPIENRPNRAGMGQTAN